MNLQIPEDHSDSRDEAQELPAPEISLLSASPAEFKPLRLVVFGQFRLFGGNGADVTPRSRKARALLARLALSRDGIETRERLSDFLWGDFQEAQARANLRQCLREIRTAIRDFAPEALPEGRTDVKLVLSSLDVDASEFKRLTQSHCWSERRRAVPLYDGRFLQDLTSLSGPFEEWLLFEQAYWRRLAEESFEELLEHDLAAERWDDVTATARKLLQLDPARETAHRALMRSQVAKGHRILALRQYDECRAILRSTFDAEPAPETRRLVAAIRAESRESSPDRQGEAAAAEAAGAEHPSIAVLPFQIAGVEPDRTHASEGMAQDIVAAISRFRWLTVVAHSSTIRYSEASIDAAQVGRALGVRYMLGGRVRLGPAGLRVSVELIEVARGKTLWAEHFQGSLGDLFGIQDEIVAKIVGQLDPMLRLAEFDRVQRRHPESLDAHDCLLRAQRLIYTVTYKNFFEARALLLRAVDLDPGYAAPQAWLGWWDVLACGQAWTQDRAAAMRHAEEATKIAIDLDPEDDLALAIAGHAASFLHRDLDRGRELLDRSLQLNPNSPFAWQLSAANRCYCGDPARALDEIGRYNQLCPFDPYPWFQLTVHSLAYFLAGRYEDAVLWGRKAVMSSPAFSAAYKPLLAALGHLGNEREWVEYRSRLMTLEPYFSISSFREQYPLRLPEHLDAYSAGLKRVGIPE